MPSFFFRGGGGRWFDHRGVHDDKPFSTGGVQRERQWWLEKGKWGEGYGGDDVLICQTTPLHPRGAEGTLHLQFVFTRRKGALAGWGRSYQTTPRCREGG